MSMRILHIMSSLPVLFFSARSVSIFLSSQYSTRHSIQVRYAFFFASSSVSNRSTFRLFVAGMLSVSVDVWIRMRVCYAHPSACACNSIFIFYCFGLEPMPLHARIHSDINCVKHANSTNSMAQNVCECMDWHRYSRVCAAHIYYIRAVGQTLNRGHTMEYCWRNIKQHWWK